MVNSTVDVVLNAALPTRKQGSEERDAGDCGFIPVMPYHLEDFPATRSMEKANEEGTTIFHALCFAQADEAKIAHTTELRKLRLIHNQAEETETDTQPC